MKSFKIKEKYSCNIPLSENEKRQCKRVFFFAKKSEDYCPQIYKLDFIIHAQCFIITLNINSIFDQ